MIFKSKAAVLATAGNSSLWFLNTELAGYKVVESAYYILHELAVK
jgi:hypothetical protein